MNRPTETTIKRLYALSGNRCAFPGCALPLVEHAAASIGEVCHIRAQKPRGPRFDADWSSAATHSFENLIVLCPNHHSIVDSQIERYTVEVLEQMKIAHERDNGRPERAEDVFAARILLRTYDRIAVSGNNANVVVDSPGSIVGQTVHVRTTRKTVKIQPPSGTIGADAKACRYIQYLINRYNKLAGADRDRTRIFSHAAVSKTVEAKFGSPWRLLAMADFLSVTTYLQERIGRTRIAKYNAARGDRSYSSFAEFSQPRRADV